MEVSIIDKIKARIKKEDTRETELSMLIAAKFHQILSSRGWKQKQLAELLCKEESEISKLLSGKHNFTIKTIALIETKLEENILEIELEEGLDIAQFSTHKTYKPKTIFIKEPEEEPNYDWSNEGLMTGTYSL